MPLYTAIVTLLAVAIYFFLATRVAEAHRRFGVRLPTTRNPDFDGIFRVHMNTLEPELLGPAMALCDLFK